MHVQPLVNTHGAVTIAHEPVQENDKLSLTVPVVDMVSQSLLKVTHSLSLCLFLAILFVCVCVCVPQAMS